jgi:hypothetical protein
MQKRTIIAAVAVAGAVAAGGSAFTASNTVEDSVAGYGTSTVSGATASSVVHTLNAEGTSITATEITFTEDQTGRTVKAAFGDASLQSCVVDATDAAIATCDYTPVFSTAGAESFNVAVS